MHFFVFILLVVCWLDFQISALSKFWEVCGHYLFKYFFCFFLFFFFLDQWIYTACTRNLIKVKLGIDWNDISLVEENVHCPTQVSERIFLHMWMYVKVHTEHVYGKRLCSGEDCATCGLFLGQVSWNELLMTWQHYKGSCSITSTWYNKMPNSMESHD